MQSRVDRQLRALALAKACASYGARVRTITHLTGLPSHDVLRMLFIDRESAPRGRAPDSPEWYHGANLLCRAEASIVVAIYRRLRIADFSAGESLVGAYRHYLGVCQPPARISFDRAFDLAAHTDAIWVTETKSFSMVTCPSCHCDFLAAYGSVALSNEHCPFCKLVQRYWTDPRVKASFPVRPLAAPSIGEVGMFTLLRLEVQRTRQIDVQQPDMDGKLPGIRRRSIASESVQTTGLQGEEPVANVVPTHQTGEQADIRLPSRRARARAQS